MTALELAWDAGRAQVDTSAGMLSEVAFRTVRGEFRPFAHAPWSPSDVSESLGHIQRLGAEFVCVPFGEDVGLTDLPEAWRGCAGASQDPGHGLAADGEWAIVSSTPHEITLRFDFPPEHALERLERTIRAIAGRPRIELELRIVARRRTVTSVGLHPILRLPDTVRGLHLEASFDEGMVHPAASAGSGTVTAGALFDDLAAVPARVGVADLSRLPLGQQTEAVVQLMHVTPPVVADYLDEGQRVLIDWDAAVLPSMLVWISDRFLSDAPWSSRYRGLGLEPIAAAFDLGQGVSTSVNPLNEDGVSTSVVIEPATPLAIRYSLSVEEK